MSADLHKQKVLQKVLKLHKLFQQGKIPTLASHEVNPGFPKASRENYIYFTLPVCLNFQRISPAMWASALKTYNDPATQYLFSPEQVIKKSREEIQTDLLKHKLGLQLNKHTDIWIAISRILYDCYNSDPRELLKQCGYDVVKIINLIQKEKKKSFPYLSGPKMTNYWLYILSHYTDAKFKNMQEISIIPDTHVLQSTVRLGLSNELLDPNAIAETWKQLLAGSSLTPVDMHPVLWNWSRNNFLPEV